MKMYKLTLSMLAAGLLIMGLSACEKEPSEKTGDAMEKAATSVTESADQTSDAVKDKMDQ
jgi:hypothetical protein